jgi:cyclic pyranopterin phosphate synthase
MRRKLTHLDAKGWVRMVDVGGKRVTAREALARGRVFMHRETLDLLRVGSAPKGNVLVTAHLAGVMAAKRTSEIIPLAHPVPLEAIDMAFSLDDAPAAAPGSSWRP